MKLIILVLLAFTACQIPQQRIAALAELDWSVRPRNMSPNSDQVKRDVDAIITGMQRARWYRNEREQKDVAPK